LFDGDKELATLASKMPMVNAGELYQNLKAVS